MPRMVLVGILVAWLVLLATIVHVLAASLRVSSRWDRLLALACFVGVFALAWWIRRSAFPLHHTMYLDEPWYLDAARGLREHHGAVLCAQSWQGLTCTAYRKALGWPVLLALVGVHGPGADFASLRLTMFFGAACASGAIAVVRASRVAWPAAIAVGLAVAVHPLHVLWSATAETHVPGTLMLLVALGLLLRAMESADVLTAAGTLAAIALAASIRPEEGAALPAAVLALLYAYKDHRTRVGILVMALASAALAAGALHPMWALNQEMSGGAFFAMRRVPSSLHALRSFSTAPTLALCALGSAVGLLALLRPSLRPQTLVLVGAVIPVFVLLLCFDRFQERMLVAVSVCALPLAGLGWQALVGEASVGRRALGLVAMVAWVSTIAHLTVVWRTRQPPAETQTLETRFAARVATEIEAGWLVAEWPTVFASASVPVMSTHEALRRGPEALMAMAARQTVYFAGDMYCEPHFGGVEHAACESFTAAFELETVFVESLHSHGFALLRVRGLRAR